MATGATAPRAAGEAGERLQLRLQLDVEAENALVEPEAHLGQRLADAGKDDPFARHPGRPRAPELAFADDVHPGAEIGERLEHGLVRIGFHRVADEGVLAGERGLEHREMPFDRGAGIAIERRVDLARDRRQIDVLGAQSAVAIGKMVHSAKAPI